MIKKILVAGSRGMAGSAIVKKLQEIPEFELLCPSHSEVDFTDQREVADYFSQYDIDQIYLAAAKVGGIHANRTYPADFIYENLMIISNVVHQSYLHGVERVLVLSSSCIYPKESPSLAIKENSILEGRVELSHEPYALAKISGIKLCEAYNYQYGTDFRSVVPTNLYGPGDNFHSINGHVIPTLIERFHQAKLNSSPNIVIWGTGNARREFLHAEDLANACVQIMNTPIEKYSQYITPECSHINVGSGKDLSIRELSELIAKITGYEGKIVYDPTKPEGPKKRLLDSSRARNLGWTPQIPLEMGLKNTYQWFLDNYSLLRK